MEFIAYFLLFCLLILFLEFQIRSRPQNTGIKLVFFFLEGAAS